MPKRVFVVFGTRPECIKLAPLIGVLRSRPTDFTTSVCASGQHHEMLDQAIAAFDMMVERRFASMQPDQGLPELTATLVNKLSSAMIELKPDWVIVQGDTTTAFAAALSGHYAQARIAHVEAGLRSHDRFNPFPEELNRRLIDSLAELHFAPTRRAVDALCREGIANKSIHLTGNTIVDALLDLKARLDASGGRELVSPNIYELAAAGGLVLVTVHRRESLGQDLEAICHAIRRIAASHPARTIVFPMHLNPKVRTQVGPLLRGIANVRLLDPLPYVDLVYLLSRSDLVLTDSGGIQEEAPSFGVPVLVLRWKTERPEAIEAGLAELVGADEERIVARAAALLSRGKDALRSRPNPFGDGRAAQRIADILARIP